MNARDVNTTHALEAFDQDELRLRRAGAHLARRDVLRRVVERLCAIEARELDHYHAARRRRAFEGDRASAARDESPAELFDDRWRELGVFAVLLRVGDVDLDQQVRLPARVLR